MYALPRGWAAHQADGQRELLQHKRLGHSLTLTLLWVIGRLGHRTPGSWRRRCRLHCDCIQPWTALMLYFVQGL